MSSKYRVSTKWTRNVHDAMARRGMDVFKLCRDADIDYGALIQKGEFVSQEILVRLWDAAVKATENKNLGLIVGNKESVIGIDKIAYMFMSCENLLHAFQTLSKQIFIIASSVNLVVIKEADEYWVDVQIDFENGPVSNQSYDSLIAWLVHMAKWVSVTDVTPIKVCFSHSEHDDLGQYVEILSCPVEFNSHKTGLRFSEKDFLRPIPTANKDLAQYHERSVFESGDVMESNHFVNQVRATIKALVHTQKLKISDAADRFNMSARTFQRRLDENGWNFRDLTDEVRKSLAIEYVCQDKYTCQGVSEKLGYAESASFLRGFKRWYKCTPSEYRRRHYYPMIDFGSDLVYSANKLYK